MAKGGGSGSALHLTGSHKLYAVPPSGGPHTKKHPAKAAYSKAAVNPPVPQDISQSGAKALGLRAKQILKPLADPNSAL